LEIKKTGTIHSTATGYDFREDKPLSLRKALHEKCLECANGSLHAVKTCTLYDCPLWPLRVGANKKERL